MKKIMLVFGTRPEAIKMAPLVKEFQKYPEAFKTIVCVTGQHREMLDQVLNIFDIHPDYDLNIMKQGQDLYDVTARVLMGMRDVIKDANPDVDFVYPMHLNPNVRKPIHEVFGEDLTGLGNMFFVEPLEYMGFIYLMEKSAIVLTDSGGIQEEAPGLGKPVLVMRDTTERPEALSAGTVKLVGTDYDKIITGVSNLLDDADTYEKMSRAVNPYGDGLACRRIVEKFQ